MKQLALIMLILVTGIPSQAQNSAPDTSFTVYSAYVKAKKTQPDIRIAHIDQPKGVRIQRDIPYCNRAGRDLALDVYYPAKKGRHPAVLLIHGGGWRSGNRAQNEPMALRLADAGYVAVSAQYRLSGEARYPAAVLDLKAAIRWMRSRAMEFGIDSTRIAIAGCSAGGQLAALIGTTNGDAKMEGTDCNTGHSSAVQAIIDIDGILAFIHPESGEGDERKGPSAATLWLGGTKDAKALLWQEASALNHVSAGTPPILFLNSSVARMHAGRDDMARRLDSLHIYWAQRTFADAPHPFWLFHPWFNPMMDEMLAFLKKVF